tara:strand:- start:1541 stop:4036 length:2496 start_codon:yes stop_codon:yes gene_type:complete
MSKNQFKSTSEEKSSSKKEPNKKPSKQGKFLKPFRNFFGFFLKEQTKQAFGLFFVLFSAYLLIAFTSFLFTWKVDQSKVELTFSDYFFNSEILVENWLGKTGASLSHLFINQWFGVGSFLFVALFFMIGFRLLFKISLLPFGKTFKNSGFALIWLSLFFGFFFQNDLHFLGGAIGFELNLFLKSILGKVGSGMFIFFLLITFLMLSFNLKPFFNSLTSMLKSDKKDTSANEIEDEDNEDSNVESIITDEYNKTEIEDEKQQENITSEAIELDIEESKPESFKNAEEEEETTEDQKEASDDLALEIEEPVEKEETLSDSEINKLVKDHGEYDPTLDLGNYKKPGIELLKDYGDGQIKVNKEELEANKDRIVSTLENYNIKIQSIKATIGPTVTLYEIIPAPGVRISKIKNLEDDIALSLAALGIRIIAPIPGKGTIGIEVPNQNPDIVSMRSVIASEKFQNSKFDLPVVMGKTISNETFVFDLAKMPHLLMAGATGQGKSVGLNAVLTSLLYKKHPSQLKFVLVDPKKVELTLFNKIERHFLAKLPDTEDAIITDNQKVINTLNSLCIEMDNRYELLKTAFVRNIKEYNEKFINRKLNPENGHKYLPYIVLVIDEFADLIMTAGKEVEQPIARLAQLARAIGIHLIIATQRPSTNIITGSIKANFPARIAFRVTSGIDSRTILDSGGAEQLIGRGDMLLSNGSDLIRIQCAFVDTPEVEELTEFIGNQRGYPDAFMLPEYIDDDSKSAGEIDLADRDALFEDAARIIVQHQQGSASLLQRRLKLGYNRAGRIIDQLEAANIIGPFEGSKARSVLITDESSLEHLLNSINENN